MEANFYNHWLIASTLFCYLPAFALRPSAALLAFVFISFERLPLLNSTNASQSVIVALLISLVLIETFASFHPRMQKIVEKFGDSFCVLVFTLYAIDAKIDFISPLNLSLFALATVALIVVRQVVDIYKRERRTSSGSRLVGEVIQTILAIALSLIAFTFPFAVAVLSIVAACTCVLALALHTKQSVADSVGISD